MSAFEGKADIATRLPNDRPPPPSSLQSRNGIVWRRQRPSSSRRPGLISAQSVTRRSRLFADTRLRQCSELGDLRHTDRDPRFAEFVRNNPGGPRVPLGFLLLRSPGTPGLFFTAAASFSQTQSWRPRASAQNRASACGPHPRRSHGRRVHLQDAADNGAIGEHVIVVIAPLRGQNPRLRFLSSR